MVNGQARDTFDRPATVWAVCMSGAPCALSTTFGRPYRDAIGARALPRACTSRKP